MTTLYEYNPHPKDMRVIREVAAYVVPAGRIFVLTALGAYFGGAFSSATSLYANGVLQIQGGFFGNFSGGLLSGTELYGPFCTMARVPDCITFPAGTVLSVGYGLNRGRAWGYLAAA